MTLPGEQHHALIVEDDPATAEDLEEILKSLPCTSTVVNNKEEALGLLQQRHYCFVLLDLEIKLAKDSIKGHVEHGLSLLREARRAHPEHAGTPDAPACFWMPILVVSGFARERDAAIGALKLGAHDIVQKPLKSGAVSEAVRSALAEAGRASHGSCSREPPQRTPVPSTTMSLVLSIQGERIHGRRTRVLVSGRAVEVPDNALTVLLHLRVGHLKDESVDKQELAGGEVHGFKGVSRLRELVRPCLGDGVDIIKNEYHGNYRLTDDVTIGVSDTAKLIEIGDAKITALAKELAKLTKSAKAGR